MMRMEDVAIVFRYQVLSPLHSYLYDGFWQKIWELISAAQSYQFPNLYRSARFLTAPPLLLVTQLIGTRVARDK